jgi:urease accessory protein
MEHDTQAVRSGRPYVFTDLPRRRGLDDVIRFLIVNGGLRE